MPHISPSNSFWISGSRRGFTYLELITIIVVIGLAGGIGLPALVASVESSRLESAAREVETAMFFAQRQAIDLGRSVRVNVDLTQKWVRVEQLQPASFPAGASVAATIVETQTYQPAADPLGPGGIYRLDFAGDDPSDRILVSAADFAGTTTLTFNDLGEPSAPGYIELTGVAGRKLRVLISSDGQVSRG